MTSSASTNIAAVETNRGPIVHWSGQPARVGDMAGPEPIDAVVAAPMATDGQELEVADSTSLQRLPKEPALPLTSLNRPATTPSRQVLPVPPVRNAPYNFRLLQQWEGTVTEIADDEFTAELRDLTDPTNYREEATFELDEVSPGDQSLLAPGAVFRWSIGYRTSASGQRERVSQLRFVRIPGWRKSAVEEIKRRATELRERFPLT